MHRRPALLRRLEQVAPVIRQRLGESERRADFLSRFGGVTLHQVGALRHLVRSGPLTMNELAGRVGISASAATQLVDRLVQQGLVEREADPSDRRVLRVAVSGLAAGAVAELEKEKRRRIKALLSALSDDELETLASLGERIAGEASVDSGAADARHTMGSGR